jgi:hypothetical protein
LDVVSGGEREMGFVEVDSPFNVVYFIPLRIVVLTAQGVTVSRSNCFGMHAHVPTFSIPHSYAIYARSEKGDHHGQNSGSL